MTKKIKMANETDKPWVGVQIAFSQPFDIRHPEKPISAENLKSAFSKIENELQVDGFIVGYSDKPELYDHCIEIAHSLGAKIYLWYALLADVGRDINVTNDMLMVNYLGEINSSWGNIKGENFQFICPNHPLFRNTIVSRAKESLEKHDFDGIFLDRIRYPSIANGLNNLFCCFCENCQRKAEQEGIDLSETKVRIRQLLNRIQKISEKDLLRVRMVLKSSSIDDLIHSDRILSSFNNFRKRNLLSVISEISDLTHRKGKEIGLDFITPSLAPLVSQDYQSMSEVADWIKPMLYCYAKVPLGIPLETRLMLNEIHKLNPGISKETLLKTASDLYGVQIYSSDKKAKTFNFCGLISKEFDKIRKIPDMRSKIYVGIEAVNIPDVCEVGPAEMSKYGEQISHIKPDGLILSWTLPLMPQENIKVITKYLNQRRL